MKPGMTPSKALSKVAVPSAFVTTSGRVSRLAVRGWQLAAASPEPYCTPISFSRKPALPTFSVIHRT